MLLKTEWGMELMKTKLAEKLNWFFLICLWQEKWRRNICIIKKNEDFAKRRLTKSRWGTLNKTELIPISRPGWWEAKPLKGIHSHTWEVIYNHYGNITEKWGNRRCEGGKN